MINDVKVCLFTIVLPWELGFMSLGHLNGQVRLNRRSFLENGNFVSLWERIHASSLFFTTTSLDFWIIYWGCRKGQVLKNRNPPNINFPVNFLSVQNCKLNFWQHFYVPCTKKWRGKMDEIHDIFIFWQRREKNWIQFSHIKFNIRLENWFGIIDRKSREILEQV